MTLTKEAPISRLHQAQETIFVYPAETQGAIPAITRGDLPRLIRQSSKLKLESAELDIALSAVTAFTTALTKSEVNAKAAEPPEVVAARAKIYGHGMAIMLEEVEAIPNRGLNINELVVSGRTGITTAIGTYQPDKGISFEDHAKSEIEIAIENERVNKIKRLLGNTTANNKPAVPETKTVGVTEHNKNSSPNPPDYSESGENIFRRRVDTVPLLTKEEEISLGMRIEEARYARIQLWTTENLPPQMITEYEKREADLEPAKSAFIDANYRLVISRARRYMERGLDLEDLIQEGSTGLMKAAERFDYKRGYRFSTFAVWWINQSISRAVIDKGSAIRIPVHMKEKVSSYTNTYSALSQELGREPRPEEVAKALKTPVEQIRFLERALRLNEMASLDIPVTGEDGDTPFSEFLADPESDDEFYEDLVQHQTTEIIDWAFGEAKLNKRERLALRIRFGIGYDKDATLEEVGDQLPIKAKKDDEEIDSPKGVSRERARQILTKALRRLRAPKIRNRMREKAEGLLS